MFHDICTTPRPAGGFWLRDLLIIYILFIYKAMADKIYRKYNVEKKASQEIAVLIVLHVYYQAVDLRFI